MCTGPKATDTQPDDDRDRRRGSRSYGTPNKRPRPPGRLWFTLLLVALTCSGGSGEGKGPWGGKGPSDNDILKGWQATPKERKRHYGWDKATPKQRRDHERGWGNRFTGLRLVLAGIFRVPA